MSWEIFAEDSIYHDKPIVCWRYWLTCLTHIESKLIPEAESSPEKETSLFALTSPPGQETKIGIPSDNVQEFR